jgi:hypothetical protein
MARDPTRIENAFTGKLPVAEDFIICSLHVEAGLVRT